MPVLPNTRHERFAQELAKGKSQTEAYETAGYQPSRSAASRLADDVNIRERVAEIAARVQAKTEVTAKALTGMLMDIIGKTRTKDEPAALNVARASIMDVAKLNGLVIDKSEVNATFAQMTPTERRARIAELEAARR